MGQPNAHVSYRWVRSRDFGSIADGRNSCSSADFRSGVDVASVSVGARYIDRGCPHHDGSYFGPPGVDNLRPEFLETRNARRRTCLSGACTADREYTSRQGGHWLRANGSIAIYHPYTRE